MHDLVEGADLGLEEADEVAKVFELDRQGMFLVEGEPFAELEGMQGVGPVIDDHDVSSLLVGILGAACATPLSLMV
jgi:hypothetical protein